LYKKSPLLATPYHHLHRNHSAILEVSVLSYHFFSSLHHFITSVLCFEHLSNTLPGSHQSKSPILPLQSQFSHFTINSNTPLCQNTLALPAPAPALAPANTLQAKQIRAMQLQMQLLQKESDTKLACKAKEAALKRRRDKELH
jgi:hypothetical protein